MNEDIQRRFRTPVDQGFATSSEVDIKLPINRVTDEHSAIDRNFVDVHFDRNINDQRRRFIHE